MVVVVVVVLILVNGSSDVSAVVSDISIVVMCSNAGDCDYVSGSKLYFIFIPSYFLSFFIY